MTTPATTEIINPLDMGFETEIAYWESHQHELTKKYPGKFLIIRGTEVCKVLDTIEELAQEFQEEYQVNPFLCRETQGPNEPPIMLVPTLTRMDNL
jgi:hypothetical protein